jgi:MFS family permease
VGNGVRTGFAFFASLKRIVRRVIVTTQGSGAIPGVTTAQNQGHAAPAPGGNVELGRRSALAGFLGTTLEYFDFFIYGTASALVFGDVFFGGGKAAMLASFATFGVSYIARPFGAMIFGHFGDRIGRRTTLLVVLMLMGGATFLIGCLPTYAQVGWLAPVLLLVLRLCQGFSAGGEVAGTSTLTVENAPAGRRGFYASFTITGCNFGIILATLIFLPIQAMPEDARMSWGWRIPFLASAILTLIAYFVRVHLVEPAAFEEVKEEKKTAKLPIGALLKSDWRNVLRVVLMILYTSANTAFTVWSVAYAKNTVGVVASVMLWTVIAANTMGLFVQPLGALISDHIGRRPMFVFGTLGCAATVFVYFHAVSVGQTLGIVLAGLLFTGLFYSSVNGIYQSFFPEMFTTKVRYSGVALGLQLGLLVAGFTPAISEVLVPEGSTNWTPMAIFVAVVCVLSAVAALTAKETYKTPLDQLGKKTVDAPAGV